MKKKLVVMWALFWPCSLLLAEETFDLAPGRNLVFSDLVFESGSATPTPAFRDSLVRLALELKLRSELCIEIGGHADSRGNPEANFALSQNRAEAVRRILLEHSALSEDCILARGYGATRPLADGGDEAAHSRNRRIEIVVLQSISKERTTNPQQEVIHHTAVLSRVVADVRTQAPWQLKPIAARESEKLFELHRISTQRGARADVSFNDKNVLKIDENALVIIYGSAAKREEERTHSADIKLLRGGLLAKLKGGTANQAPTRVSTKAATTRLSPGSAGLRVDDQERTSVSVFSGSGTVAAQGDEVAVAEGFGTSVAEGKAPQTPRPLPRPPTLTSRSRIRRERGKASIVFAPTTDQTRVVVSKANGETVFRAHTASNEVECDLPDGTYDLALTAIDDGLESVPSEQPQRIEIFTQPQASARKEAVPPRALEEPHVLRLGVMLAADVPVDFAKQYFGFNAGLQLGWLPISWFVPFIRLSGGGLVSSAKLHPYVAADVGGQVYTPTVAGSRGFAELTVGGFIFAEDNYPEKANGRAKASFAPSLGIGLEQPFNGWRLTETLSYRLLLDGLSATSDKSRIHGLIDIRLGLSYE